MSSLMKADRQQELSLITVGLLSSHVAVAKSPLARAASPSMMRAQPQGCAIDHIRRGSDENI